MILQASPMVSMAEQLHSFLDSILPLFICLAVVGVILGWLLHHSRIFGMSSLLLVLTGLSWIAFHMTDALVEDMPVTKAPARASLDDDREAAAEQQAQAEQQAPARRFTPSGASSSPPAPEPVVIRHRR